MDRESKPCVGARCDTGETAICQGVVGDLGNFGDCEAGGPASCGRLAGDDSGVGATTGVKGGDWFCGVRTADTSSGEESPSLAPFELVVGFFAGFRNSFTAPATTAAVAIATKTGSGDWIFRNILLRMADRARLS